MLSEPPQQSLYLRWKPMALNDDDDDDEQWLHLCHWEKEYSIVYWRLLAAMKASCFRS